MDLVSVVVEHGVYEVGSEEPPNALLQFIIDETISAEPAEQTLQTSLDVIFTKKKSGKTVQMTSQRLKNIIVNWRDIMTVGVPALGRMSIAGLAHPAVAILYSMSTYRAVVGLFEIELSSDHARLVELIWNQDEARILKYDLITKLAAGQVENANELLSDLCQLGITAESVGEGGHFIERADIIVCR